MTMPTFPVASPRRVLSWLAILLPTALAGGCGKPAAPDANFGKPAIAAVAPTATSQPWPALDPKRKLPGGTLVYTIELNGKIDKRGPQPDYHHTASIHRVINVSTHMRGDVANGDLAQNNPDAHPGAKGGAASPMEGMQQAIEACGDNQICQQAVMMKLMSDPQQRRAVQSFGEAQIALLGRTDWWRQDAPCQGHILVDDRRQTTSWFEEYGEGYHVKKLVTATGTRRADKPFDCTADPMRQAAGATLFLDTQTGDYDLVFLPIVTTVDATENKRAVAGRKAGSPKIVITGFGGANEGQPIHGSKTVSLQSDDRIPVPMTATVSWAFTPEAPS